ncbi:hypothetical protein [Streptomyces sp. CA-179760]|uniref:hypothetical protein n=1 Tax=Streptomyces sp. CA-179760 TaxID=3240054 RepID=UPI003D8B558A
MQLQDDKRHQEVEAARRAVTPDVLRHALLRALARIGLLDSLSEDERAAVNWLSDPAAAFAVNALFARAHEAGAGPRSGQDGAAPVALDIVNANQR